MKKIVAFIIILICFGNVAYADDYILNAQKNFDAYTYTIMPECYSYYKIKGQNFTPTSKYFGNTGSGNYIVYKNMNFGNIGASCVKLDYSTYGDYDGRLEFRKNSPTGEILATFNSENNNFWYDPVIRTKPISNPSEAVGRFDLYVVIKGGPFGNLYGFEFVESQSAFDEVNAFTALDRYKGIPDENVTEEGVTFNIDDPLLLGDDYSRNIEYYIGFENNSAKQITVDIDARIGGKMRIYDDCPSGELLQEIILKTANGKQTFDASEKIKELKGLKNICIAFDNSVDVTLKSFSFSTDERIFNVEKTVFGADNCTELKIATNNNSYIGKMGSTAAWIKWANVDFGQDVWPVKMTVSYGINSNYHGSVMNVHLDSPDGEIIAKANIDFQPGMDWEVPKTTVSSLLKEVTGVHDIYVTVEPGEYADNKKAGNIFSIDFEKINSKYLVTYNVTGYLKNPQVLSSVLSFLNDEDNPENITYIMAAYTSDGKLIVSDYDVETVYEGLNSFERSLEYSKLEDEGNYIIKVFVWDENNTPLVKENNTVGEVIKENI